MSFRLASPVGKIPDHLTININSLEVGDVVQSEGYYLTEGASLIKDPDAIVVQCEVPQETPEEVAEGAMDGSEPEVIGKEDSDEGDGDGDSVVNGDQQELKS